MPPSSTARRCSRRTPSPPVSSTCSMNKDNSSSPAGCLPGQHARRARRSGGGDRRHGHVLSPAARGIPPSPGRCSASTAGGASRAEKVVAAPEGQRKGARRPVEDALQRLQLAGVRGEPDVGQPRQQRLEAWRPIMRASGAPRQKWMPLPKARAAWRSRGAREALRLRERRVVAIRGGVEQQHERPGRDVDAAELRVRLDVARHATVGALSRQPSSSMRGIREWSSRT